MATEKSGTAVEDIMLRCNLLGVVLTPTGDGLRATASEPIPADLAAAIGQQKAAILERMRRRRTVIRRESAEIEGRLARGLAMMEHLEEQGKQDSPEYARLAEHWDNLEGRYCRIQDELAGVAA